MSYFHGDGIPLTPAKVAEFIGKEVTLSVPSGNSMSGILVMVGRSGQHYDGPVIAMLDYGYGIEVDAPGLTIREGL